MFTTHGDVDPASPCRSAQRPASPAFGARRRGEAVVVACAAAVAVAGVAAAVAVAGCAVGGASRTALVSAPRVARWGGCARPWRAGSARRGPGGGGRPGGAARPRSAGSRRSTRPGRWRAGAGRPSRRPGAGPGGFGGGPGIGNRPGIGGAAGNRRRPGLGDRPGIGVGRASATGRGSTIGRESASAGIGNRPGSTIGRESATDRESTTDRGSTVVQASAIGQGSAVARRIGDRVAGGGLANNAVIGGGNTTINRGDINVAAGRQNQRGRRPGRSRLRGRRPAYDGWRGALRGLSSGAGPTATGTGTTTAPTGTGAASRSGPLRASRPGASARRSTLGLHAVRQPLLLHGGHGTADRDRAAGRVPGASPRRSRSPPTTTPGRSTPRPRRPSRRWPTRPRPRSTPPGRPSRQATTSGPPAHRPGHDAAQRRHAPRVPALACSPSRSTIRRRYRCTPCSRSARAGTGQRSWAFIPSVDDYTQQLRALEASPGRTPSRPPATSSWPITT